MMRLFVPGRLAILCALTLSAGSTGASAQAPGAAENARGEVSADRRVLIQSESDGLGLLHVSARNMASVPQDVDIPAGTIYRSGKDSALVTCRAARFTVPGGATMDAEIPAVVLSSQTKAGRSAYTATPDREPRLAPLFDFLATKDDFPVQTAQLLVLSLMENIGFQGWVRFSSRVDSGPEPNQVAAAVVQAIDALGVLRTVYPEQTFVIAADPELKARALRNPVTRAKAQHLYGIALPDDPATPAGVAPDIGRLLHTKAGDNCPVCKMRQQGNRSGAGEI